MSEREGMALWVPRLAGAGGLVLGELTGKNVEAAGTVAVLPDGVRMAVGFADGTIRCVSLKTGEELWVGNPPCREIVQSVACTRQGTVIATGADLHFLRVWNAGTGVLLWEQDQKDTVWDMRFSADGMLLAVAGSDDSVSVWHVKTGQCVLRCEGHDAWVVSVDWSPRGDRLVSASNDGTLRLWDAASGTEQECRKYGCRPQWVAWSLLEECLAVGWEDGFLSLFDTGGAGGLSSEVMRWRADTTCVNCAAWSPDGHLIATAGDNQVRIWDAGTVHCLLGFGFDETYARHLVWAPSGAFIAVSLCGDVVRLWDVRGALTPG